MSIKAGTKRGRAAWEECEDVDRLKELLEQQLAKIDKLSKENAGGFLPGILGRLQWHSS